MKAKSKDPSFAGCTQTFKYVFR